MVAGFLRSVLFSWRLRDAAADCFIREGLRAVFRHLQPNIRIYGGIWSCGHCRMDGGYGIVTGSVRLPEMPLWARVGFKQACYSVFWYSSPWKGFCGCMRLIRCYKGMWCFYGKDEGQVCQEYPCDVLWALYWRFSHVCVVFTDGDVFCLYGPYTASETGVCRNVVLYRVFCKKHWFIRVFVIWWVWNKNERTRSVNWNKRNEYDANFSANPEWTWNHREVRTGSDIQHV